MKCLDAQLEMLQVAPTELSPQVAAHLETCADCRAFAQTANDLSRLPDLEPSPRLDRNVLQAVRGEMRQKAAVAPQPRRFAWVAPLSWGLAAAAVAVFALSALLQRQGSAPAPPVVAAQVQSWNLGELDEDLELLEAQLAVESMMLTASNGSESGNGDVSLDQAIWELDATLAFEKEAWQL
jgi:hypothetical protein